MEQKPDIVKTRVPIAEENLPSFATTDSKKLRPVWISGIVNYVVMVIVISAIAFSTPKEEFRTGGWAKEFVDNVGKVIPAVKKHELLRKRGDRTTRIPFVFACLYSWLLVSNLCVVIKIKRPFLYYNGCSFRKLVWTCSGIFLALLGFTFIFLESPDNKFNIYGFPSAVLHGIFVHFIFLYFFFFLANVKELFLCILSLAGGSHEWK